MRILTSQQCARVIGGASAISNSTLEAEQLSNFRLDDQKFDGAAGAVHSRTSSLGDKPGVPVNTASPPPDKH